MSDWIVTFICLVRYTRIVISIGFLAVLLGVILLTSLFEKSHVKIILKAECHKNLVKVSQM